MGLKESFTTMLEEASTSATNLQGHEHMATLCLPILRLHDCCDLLEGKKALA